MSTNIVGMGLAAVAVVGLVATLGGLSLLVGAINTFFGRPQLKFLKSTIEKSGLAFSLSWNEAKENAKFNMLRIRLFNPFGSPTQLEMAEAFDPIGESFAKDIDFHGAFERMMKVDGLDKATIHFEFSSKEGISFDFSMKGAKFLKQLSEATQTVDEFLEVEVTEEAKPAPVYGVVPKGTVADTVPGRGNHLKIATNPLFSGHFSGGAPAASGGAGGDAPAAAEENFKLEKVWIIEGCIVCNACEDIYPEVFEVLADTCIVRPNPPLDDGLRVEEAADACPVEVIKFSKAAGQA